MKIQLKIGAAICVGIIGTVSVGLLLRTQEQKPLKHSLNYDAPLRINSPSTVESLDSTGYTTQTAAATIANLFDGLYGHDGKGNIIADISDGNPDVSKDKLTYTFHLRNYHWANGTAVTADDFVYAWQRLANPAVASRNASRIDILKNGAAVRMGTKSLQSLGVKALDAKTLHVTLSAPNPHLFEALAAAPFMPINRAFAVRQGRAYGKSAANILTNGPYTIAGWSGTDDKTWIFHKNKSYYFRKNVQLTRINFTVNTDSVKAAADFSGQRVDYTAIDAATVPTYLGNRSLHRMSTTTCAYMIFNTIAGPTKNLHLRKALATAFDKRLFARGTLRNGATPLNGIVPTGLATNQSGADFRQQNGDILAYNTASALSEWHKAQRELGRSHITVTINIADSPEAVAASQFLKSQLEHNLPGLKITIVTTSLEQRVELENERNFEAVISTWTPSDTDPYNFLTFYLTDSRLNISGYTNPKYDAMLKAIQNIGDEPTKRWQKELAAEKYLLNTDAPMTGIYQGGIAYLLSSRVETFPVMSTGIINLEYVRMH